MMAKQSRGDPSLQTLSDVAMAFRNGIEPGSKTTIAAEVSESSSSSRTGECSGSGGAYTSENNEASFASPVSDDGNEGSGEDSECRKKLLRERNRVHARLSRQRKRQRLEALQEENSSLQRDCKQAREEITRLRGLLEECDYENSRLRAWVDGVTQASAPSALAVADNNKATTLSPPPNNYPYAY